MIKSKIIIDFDWNQFKDALKKTLQLQLPGLAAHLELAPQFRIPEMLDRRIPDIAQKSSVLLLLFPEHGVIKSVVIVRQSYDGAHSGQVALPGGKQESQDIDYWHTALRETQEEIGVEPSTIEQAGELSQLYISRSNFLVFPFVGFLDKRPEFIMQTEEVKELLVFDIFDSLSKKKRLEREIKISEAIKFQAPGYEIQNHFMWGATAMIFNEFMQLVAGVQ